MVNHPFYELVDVTLSLLEEDLSDARVPMRSIVNRCSATLSVFGHTDMAWKFCSDLCYRLNASSFLSPRRRNNFFKALCRDRVYRDLRKYMAAQSYRPLSEARS